MKKTVPLKVVPELKMLEDRVVIHPNDGFDLGFMNREYDVWLVMSESITAAANNYGETHEGHIYLENDCPQGKVVLSQKSWKKLGAPANLILVYKEPRLYVMPPK